MDETILFEAVKRGKVELVKLLLEEGANLAYRDEAGRSALHEAAGQRGDEMYAIAHMLLEAGANPNLYDWNDRTPLHYACHRTDAKLCQLLLEHGANPHAGSGGIGTPLIGVFYAATGGNDVREVCKILVKHGACANTWHPKEEKLALHLAIDALKSSIAVHKGKKVNHFSMPEDFMEVVGILVGGGADPSFLPADASPSYLTPFQYAVKNGLVELVRYFVEECGEDPVQRTHRGRSLVQLAGKNEAMKALINALKTELVIHGSLSSKPVEIQPDALRRKTSSPSL